MITYPAHLFFSFSIHIKRCLTLCRKTSHYILNHTDCMMGLNSDNRISMEVVDGGAEKYFINCSNSKSNDVTAGGVDDGWYRWVQVSWWWGGLFMILAQNRRMKVQVVRNCKCAFLFVAGQNDFSSHLTEVYVTWSNFFVLR